MPGGSRSLPVRPSLRFLKLEAKRRLAAGEFATLHDAQAAIAREHGLPSWAALKQACALRPEPESHALDQLRWVISRFSGADAPGWKAPEQDEIREHFDDGFLAVLPASDLVAQISKMAADLRGELVVIGARPLDAVVQLAGLRYYATADAAPPHRLTGLRGVPFGDQSEHGGRGDQRGHAGPVEPVADVQGLGPVEVGVAHRDDPRRGAGLAAGQDQGSQAEFGAGPGGQADDLVGRLAEGADRRRRLHARVGDPVAEGNSP